MLMVSSGHTYRRSLPEHWQMQRDSLDFADRGPGVWPALLKVSKVAYKVVGILICLPNRMQVPENSSIIASYGGNFHPQKEDGETL